MAAPAKAFKRVWLVIPQAVLKDLLYDAVRGDISRRWLIN